MGGRTGWWSFGDTDESATRGSCKIPPLPPGDDCRDAGGRVTQGAVTEGWGAGIKKDNTLILFTLTLALSLKGEGIQEFCKCPTRSTNYLPSVI
jgi:hypothetical protein